VSAAEDTPLRLDAAAAPVTPPWLEADLQDLRAGGPAAVLVTVAWTPRPQA
jgi:hypothetical protein